MCDNLEPLDPVEPEEQDEELNTCHYCDEQFSTDESIPPDFYSADGATSYYAPNGCICFDCQAEHLDFDRATMEYSLKEGHSAPVTMEGKPMQAQQS
jgi:hypothetical protein